ncbi:hypothetical protein DOTSEDRAFT_73496 [Dothistroma septosporum NZE10]|uniref:Uncharacterized protein n=1 Tax=Dothistroma septosporum (strain NZE10 / CBS 128990) TaxID=675120 RepID=N1PML8_DOTSN|nr:hypothetical protein DOTSEDRAFT_73496 [Dothistroma septosporum NZE10]
MALAAAAYQTAAKFLDPLTCVDESQEGSLTMYRASPVELTAGANQTPQSWSQRSSAAACGVYM